MNMDLHSADAQQADPTEVARIREEARAAEHKERVREASERVARKSAKLNEMLAAYDRGEIDETGQPTQ